MFNSWTLETPIFFRWSGRRSDGYCGSELKRMRELEQQLLQSYVSRSGGSSALPLVCPRGAGWLTTSNFGGLAKTQSARRRKIAADELQTTSLMLCFFCLVTSITLRGKINRDKKCSNLFFVRFCVRSCFGKCRRTGCRYF